MLRMIIADDEKIIRETISTAVDWASLDIEVVGLCKNGLEAYDMILDEYPDIVMTDIKMPGLSGLDLIERITQTGQKIEFVILSGYGDYEFTKVAMKFGITHYLLKPCNLEELVEVMGKVKTACYRNRAKVVDQEYMMLRGLHESVMHNLLIECMSERPNFEDIVARYERFLNFTGVGYELCIFPNARLGDKTFYQRLCACHNAEAPGLPLHCVFTGKRVFAAFETYSNDFSAMDQRFAGLDPEYCRKSYHCLNELLPVVSKYLHTKERVWMADESGFIELRSGGSGAVKHYLNLLEQSGSRNLDSYLSEIDHAMDNISDLAELRSFVSGLLVNLPSNYADGKVSGDFARSVLSICELENAEQIRTIASKCLRGWVDERQGRLSTGTDFVDKTVAYVYEHIDDPDLSLKSIAENYLFMDVGYVGKKFVKTMNCKFSAFLAHVRIEKAKRLLLENETVSIQDVAQAVGCGNNPRYFSQIFKKATGQTPSSYAHRRGLK